MCVTGRADGMCCGMQVGRGREEKDPEIWGVNNCLELPRTRKDWEMSSLVFVYRGDQEFCLVHVKFEMLT